MTVAYTVVACSRGCGLRSRPGPVARHEKTCWTPATLERLYEIGGVDVTQDGCWEWQGVEGGTFEWYPRIGQRKVMRLVCTAAYGPPLAPSDRPLHACDNVRCVRVDHLRWGSQSDNVRDTYAHGRR